MFANDLIANTSISAPHLQKMTEYLKEEMNPEIKKEKFETRIKNKYHGLKINNVSEGIKHIKMVKYFNGRPVRINVVEINRQVAKIMK